MLVFLLISYSYADRQLLNRLISCTMYMHVRFVNIWGASLDPCLRFILPSEALFEFQFLAMLLNSYVYS